MDKHSVQVMILIFVLFAQIDSNTTDTSMPSESTMITSTEITTELTSSSLSYSSSIVTTPTTSSYLTSTVTSESISTVSHSIDNLSFISSTHTIPVIINSSEGHVSSSFTSTKSTTTTSTLPTSPISNISTIYIIKNRLLF